MKFVGKFKKMKKIGEYQQWGKNWLLSIRLDAIWLWVNSNNKTSLKPVTCLLWVMTETFFTWLKKTSKALPVWNNMRLKLKQGHC